MSDITWHKGEPKQDGRYIVEAHSCGNYRYRSGSAIRRGDDEVRVVVARWLQGKWHAESGIPAYWTGMEVLKWAALQAAEQPIHMRTRKGDSAECGASGTETGSHDCRAVTCPACKESIRYQVYMGIEEWVKGDDERNKKS